MKVAFERFMYYEYGEKETEYLKARDPKLGEAIDRIGHVEREVDEDLFAAVIHQIIGQQIATKALDTIWGRMQDRYGRITADAIAGADPAKLQSLGTTFRKVEYMQDFARKVQSGEFDLEAVAQLPDDEAIRALASLRGIGVWTAEMILLFCLQRPDVFSYDDLAIVRGLRMLYHHRKVDRKLFEKYRRRFSPYGSVASLYLWAIAGGAIPELHDWQPKKKPAPADKSKKKVIRKASKASGRE